jgi:hypothetical protein
MAGNKQSLDDWAASFGISSSPSSSSSSSTTPTPKPEGLRSGVETPAQKAAREKKKKDNRTLRQKMRDRRKVLDEI